MVDALSLSKIGPGAVIEHVDTVKETKFQVNKNPLADSECGCKVSFALKGT